MARKKNNTAVNEEKLKLSDIVSFAKSGWTPGEVNAILDRFDAIGDVNAPIKEDDDDEILDTKISDQDESFEDEEDIDEGFDEEKVSDNKLEDEGKLDLLEAENTRLKKQIEKLQLKNRTKDLSDGDERLSPEESLINRFQSLFN